MGNEKSTSPFCRISASLDTRDEGQKKCYDLLMNAGYKKNRLLSIMAAEVTDKYNLDTTDKDSILEFIKVYPYLSAALAKQGSLPTLQSKIPLSPPADGIASKESSILKDDAHFPETISSDKPSDENIDMDAADDVLKAFGI